MNTGWRTTLPPEGGPGEKEKINVLLVSVDCTADASRTPMLAPAFLAAHARRDPLIKRHVEFDIRQFSADQPVEAIIQEILAKNYQVIGFSCYVWNYQVYRQLIPVLKRLRPDALLIMGGQQVLGRERETLNHFPDLDIVVYQEGECALSEITGQVGMGKRDWSGIGGVIFRSGEELVDTYAKKKRLKFADIASPYLDGVITGRHQNLFLETYRGCPYHCAFCAWGRDEGRKIDPLPLERVRQELEVIGNMGADTLGIFDSNFNLPAERGRKIFDMIRANQQFKVVGTSIFAQYLHEELAGRMGEIQTMTGVGLQSTDPETNAKMKRRFMMDRMTKGIRLMNKHKIQFVLQVIVGLPGDTYRSIAETLNYSLNLNPPTIDAFRLMVLPGTEYRRQAGRLGIIYEPNPYHYVISHYSMDVAEINRAERMAQALTVFYNLPGTRREMFRQAGENNETVVDFCDAIGVFIDNFNLLDRQELRKGDIIRKKDEQYLLEILRDFKRFRKDLAESLTRERLIREII
jgi:radical SAM superfamily enzyme YgiQ (UPF0313 family)